MNQVTKPGKFGTLKLYEYTYRDVTDHCNAWKSRAWRYSLEHLREAFLDENGHPSEHDSSGWELVSARPVRN